MRACNDRVERFDGRFQRTELATGHQRHQRGPRCAPRMSALMLVEVLLRVMSLRGNGDGQVLTVY